VSKKFWDKLSPEQQQIIKDSALEARTYQRQVARAQSESAKKMMAEHGMQINEVSDAEHERMRERVQPVWKMFIPDVGQDLFDQVQAELK